MHNQFWCGAGSGTAAQLRQVPGHPGRRGPDAALGSDTASAGGASGDRGLGLLKLLPGCGQRGPWVPAAWFQETGVDFTPFHTH